jgi:hypothetical protein
MEIWGRSGALPILKVKEESGSENLHAGVMSLMYVKVNPILKLLTNFKL